MPMLGVMANRHDRWAARPVYGRAVSALVFFVPLAAAMGASWFARRLIDPPNGFGLQVLWWLALVGLSAVVFAVVERWTRRLLPLAALLKMTLVFPDRAPSRLAVARRAARTKDLEGRIDRAMHEAPPEDEDMDASAAKILALAAALSSHDRRTRGHSERVRVLTDMIADELDLPEKDRDRLRWSALLHDIGKLTVHPDILNKPGKPDVDQWAILRRHPLEGAKLVAPLAPWLGEWVLAVEQHHEQYGGAGYPYGLRGAGISRGAKIVAVADVFETMTAKRSYQDAIRPAMARVELTRCAGTQFDPDVVRAFLNISLGELRWAVGPGSLIAQLPFLGQLPLLGGQTTGALAGLSSATAFGTAAMSMTSIMVPHAMATSARTSSIGANGISVTRVYSPITPPGAPSATLTDSPVVPPANDLTAPTPTASPQPAGSAAVPVATSARGAGAQTSVATKTAAPGSPPSALAAPRYPSPLPARTSPPSTGAPATTAAPLIAAAPSASAASTTTVASAGTAKKTTPEGNSNSGANQPG